MKIIKKIWPDKFEEDKNLNLDFRLADFKLSKGDEVTFKEWNPKTKKFTGRQFQKVVKQAIKSESPTRYWKKEELEKHGLWLIEWEE
jgi:hypothetical protein